MILDSPALVAILFGEPEGQASTNPLPVTDGVRMAAPSWLETFLVLEGRTDGSATTKAGASLSELDIRIVPFDATMAVLAREAYRRYGRGRHPARLNFGNCMAYALAKATHEPLLFKGDDFPRTDATPALP